MAETALSIARYFPSVNVDSLTCAALLHDVAKELSREEQAALINDFNIELSKEDAETYPALHSFAGVALIKRDFPELATDEILSAVRNHTLGDPDMSLMDKIVFIADYVEPGRTNKSCRAVGDFLMSSLKLGDNTANIKALNSAVVMAIEYTAEYLESSGKPINSRSAATHDAIKSLI